MSYYAPEPFYPGDIEKDDPDNCGGCGRPLDDEEWALAEPGYCFSCTAELNHAAATGEAPEL